MESHLNGQPSATQAPAQADRSIQPLTLMLVLAMAAVLFFVGLGATGLTDRDEGRNAEAGREMYETGDYISPTFNYEPRFAKPVFVYWLMSLSYHAFGVNEFAARFPSALFGRSHSSPVSLPDALPRPGDRALRRGDVIAEP